MPPFTQADSLPFAVVYAFGKVEVYRHPSGSIVSVVELHGQRYGLDSHRMPVSQADIDAMERLC